MANALNRQYLSKIRNLILSIPPTETDPLEKFTQVVGDKVNSFTFKLINMSELRKEISKMRPTASEGLDTIPMRAIKAAANELAPLLLELVNSTISKTTFPTEMKTTKIIPIRKTDKEKTSSEGWRPINIVQAISNIIERVYLRQILNYLEVNNLVNHSHHGGVKGKSTQSILNEVHDNLVETLENEEDAALVLIDQSKAFDIIEHQILLKKTLNNRILEPSTENYVFLSLRPETVCPDPDIIIRLPRHWTELRGPGKHPQWGPLPDLHAGHPVHHPRDHPQPIRLQTVQTAKPKNVRGRLLR